MPTLDHPVVERMKAAGAIPIGRTNMPDMGLRLHTDSALYGLTRNPWNLARTVGGSSGGEAAALATGMSPLGLGNDIGGSLRNPAFCCGIASLKPSFGRIPHASSLEPSSGPLATQMMMVQGPMARCVADLALGLGVLAGAHPRDPMSYSAPLEGPAPQQPINVALVPHPPGGTTASALRDAVRAAGAALEAAGYRVEEVTPPLVEDAVRTWGRWLSWEFAVMREQLTAAMSPDATRFFGAFMELFGTPTYADSVLLMIERHRIARAWSEFFAKYPIVVGPTWCEPQFAHGYDIANAEQCGRHRQSDAFRDADEPAGSACRVRPYRHRRRAADRCASHRRPVPGRPVSGRGCGNREAAWGAGTGRSARINPRLTQSAGVSSPLKPKTKSEVVAS